MSLSSKQIIFSKNIASLIVYADMIGIDLTFGDAFRSRSQMLLNYFGYTLEKGGVFGIRLSKGRKLSNTLNSLHGKRLAVDFNFFIDGELTYNKERLSELGVFWEGLHKKNKWGGNFKSFTDTSHFQMSE